MKYVNEYDGKAYNSEEECRLAEEKYLKQREIEKQEKERRAASRKEAANRVDAARKAMNEAQSAYRKELESFCKTYGTYHTSLNSSDVPTLFDLLNLF